MPVTQADRGSGAPPNSPADRPSQMQPSSSPGHLPPGSDDRSACRTRWLVILRMSSASPVPGDADDPLLGKCFACSGQRAKVADRSCHLGAIACGLLGAKGEGMSILA